ncbi:hypothetical protein K6119_05190 [Paracrocinitomix mangrovi]|uniref:hypothetical protein n=1 Tax=Paracrocinitomix mangrovi TaxID=2862509 RepID=UPI001C8D14AB|nr:hypothetical protein [Paracrocinitomix mangrovi]UKN02908.1 hypothetical protein K6119_05190 [Paracrocinitomix mangrovi]
MRTIALSILTLLFATTVSAQTLFKTGSTELDNDLTIINKEAKTDLGLFKTDLSVEFGVSVGKIDNLLNMKMEPGEIYLSLEISKIGGRSLDDVVKCYKSNKDKGWGYIAKEMGIKPGSAEFHELKGNSKNKKNKGNSGSKGGSNGSSNKGNSGKGNSGKGKK